MSAKVKRKVTVENSRENSDHPKRPSVFERLGPGAVNVPSQSQDRPSRIDQNEKCRNWLRDGTCPYGNTCRFQHNFQATSRRSKNEKDVDDKNLRRKMKNIKREEIKESKTGSISPKRKEKKRRSRSRSRKGEHESKIKSTVVVTRPRSPTSTTTTSQVEPSEKDKKKADERWEDDSDDWPIDAAQLDYKEELTLERKRQQLQRELELELQKEKMLAQNRSGSDSSSSSSSSDSGSISSSSDSSSSSSDEDSDESSSSSSSTSSSASRTPVKKKSKKQQIKKEPTREASHKKPLDDYDKIKSSRALKTGWRPRSPPSPEISIKKNHKKKGSPLSNFSPKRRSGHDVMKAVPFPSGRKGPRTPSPAPVVSKQRQWAQSSSADSRSAADTRRNRSKRHKKKKDSSKTDRARMEYAPTPPPLSSPNRTVLQAHLGKKSHHREDSGLRGHHRGHDQSPPLLSRVSGQSNSPSLRQSSHYSDMDRFSDKQSQSKSHKKLDDTCQPRSRKDGNKELSKHSRISSPGKDSRRLSISPVQDKYDNDSLSKGMYSPPLSRTDKDDNRRRGSLSPRKGKEGKERRKGQNDSEKRRENRDFSPRLHDTRRDNQYRNNDLHRKEEKDNKKKEDKIKDRGQKDRNLDHDNWSDEPKKGMRSSDSRRIVEPALPQSARGDRNRDRDRKNKKDREPPLRPVEAIERERRLSPTVSLVPGELHHVIRDDISRGRIYDSEIPPENRDYAYGYVQPRDPMYLDEPPLQPDYEADLRVSTLYHPPTDSVDYPPPTYSETRYRRDPALKAVTPVPHIDRISSYGAHDISPLDPRDPVGLPVREDDDYLADLSIDDRPYDERWSRNRPVRDDWDPFPPLVPETLPPHVVTGLDEDRYGMPRRRRASPNNWMVRRGDDRDIPLREPRSRSPAPHRRDDVGSTGRGSWGEHHNNRNDLRQDNQQKSGMQKQHVKKLRKNEERLYNFFDGPKNSDDRKNRNNRRDRRDRGKRTDDLSSEIKPPISKEKIGAKRPHSISPNRKDLKKRKDDDLTNESTLNEKSSIVKKAKEELRSDSKMPPLNRKRNKVTGEDDFSDWSEGDDDLLNRDDFVESESNSGDRVLSKSDNRKEKSSKLSEPNVKESDRKPKRDSSKDSRMRSKELKTESHARTSSKERYDSRDFERLLNYSRKSIDGNDRNRIQPVGSKRIVSEVPTVKLGPIPLPKEKSPIEPVTVKKENSEAEKFIQSENDEYDPISDEEFEALIEEPDEALIKTNGNEETKIVDAFDINWSTLMNNSKPELAPSKARNRFKAVHVLSRIGFSQSLAGNALSEKIMQFCQKQLDEERENENGTPDSVKDEKKFVMEHPVAAFHVSLMQKKKERRQIFDHIGPSRRALCARQDLYIRKLLCRPAVNLLPTTTCVQQYSSVETEQIGKSPQKIGSSTVVNAAC